MLEYDEWVVPGEVEYAEKKAAEIESHIQKYHKDTLRGDWERKDWKISIQLTEHVTGVFKVTIPKYVWDYAIDDIDISNSMKADWLADEVYHIDAPKIFDIPDDDIRASLPPWDEPLFPADAREETIYYHSERYIISGLIEEDPSPWFLEKLNISESRYEKARRGFLARLKSEKPEDFTDLEKKIIGWLRSDGLPFDVRGHHYNNYEPWRFPVDTTKDEIISAVTEAYINASKRSRRIIPKEIDCENLDRGLFEADCHPIKNYECLYQAKGGGRLPDPFLIQF